VIVLDTSTTLSWFFEDERDSGSAALLSRVAVTGAVTPSLWKLEVANALAVAVRRGRCTLDFADETLARLARMRITIDGETAIHAWAATRALSAAHGLTIYDATFLELAQRRSLPLATCDRRLAAAAQTLGLDIVTT